MISIIISALHVSRILTVKYSSSEFQLEISNEYKSSISKMFLYAGQTVQIETINTTKTALIF